MKYSVIRIDDYFDFYDLEREVLSSDSDDDGVLIFVSKNLVSLMDSGQIKRFLNKSLNILKKVNIFYLSYNSESCQEMRIIGKWNNINFIKPHSPMGFDAVASTKKDWKKILKKLKSSEEKSLSVSLNNLVVSEEISAVSTWPMIFQQNFKKLGTHSVCRNEKEEKIEVNKVYQLSQYYYYVSFIFFAIFLLYLYYKKN